MDLLIFDEAHNAVGKSCYSKIMKWYYHPLPHEERPHIVGMTASPGDDREYWSTERRILDLTEILDSSLAIVHTHKAELDAYVNKFEQRIISYELNPQEEDLRGFLDGCCAYVQRALTGHTTGLQGQGLNYHIEWENFAQNAGGTPGMRVYQQFVEQQMAFAQNLARPGIELAFRCLQVLLGIGLCAAWLRPGLWWGRA